MMYGHEHIKALIAIILMAAAIGLFAALAEAKITATPSKAASLVSNSQSPHGDARGVAAP